MLFIMGGKGSSAQLHCDIDLKHGDKLYIPPGYWHFVEYRDIGFSMSLRAFPRTPGNLSRMLYNLLILRSVDRLMCKVVGQPWNDRNERRAVTRTHRRLARAV